MNKIRRKKLAQIVAKLGAMEDLRTEILEDMETVYNEEQDALDNLPDSLQTGERAEQMRDYIYSLEAAMSALDNVDVESVRDFVTEIYEEGGRLHDR